jgi:hypothetical protein
MTHDLSQTTALLSHTPAALNGLLRDLPESWTMKNEGEGSWRVFDVVGHLVQIERSDWMPRIKTVLEHGDAKTFEKVDRSAHAKETAGKTMPQLLDEFARLRARNLDELAALKLRPSDFEKTGSHPALGTVTLSELVSTWATHDMTHLHQITRTLAYQYREAVGPWGAYLGVLKCSGHGG